VNKQRAANAFFKRVQRTVHAHAANIQRLRRAGNVSLLHKRHKNLKLAEGYLCVYFHARVAGSLTLRGD